MRRKNLKKRKIIEERRSFAKKYMKKILICIEAKIAERSNLKKL